MVKIDQFIRSKRKTITLQIKADGRLIVRAPLRVNIDQIYKFINKKKDWIISKQLQMRTSFEARQQRRQQHEAVNEEGILFLAKRVFYQDALNLKKSQLIAWYKKEALKYLLARVDYFTQKYGLKYHSVKINSAKTRWGSCSARGNINFSYRLVLAPAEVVDYVVIHEIAHLKHRDHSARFWNFVGVMMPGYKEYQGWLKKNGFLLDV